MSEHEDIVKWLRTSDAPVCTAAVEIRRLHSENAALRSALRECADDLAGEIEARCPPELRRGPDAARKYERDMAPVLRARALLASTTEGET